MKNAFVVTILLSCCVLLTGCPENSNGDEPTKDSYDNLVIEFYDGGGMLPVTEKFYISNDSASWFYDRFGGETTISWIPKPEDLQSIYKTLIENDYTNIISIVEGEVFDRGGIVLNFTVDGTHTEINNSGNSFVDGGKRTEYNNILQKLKTYVDGEVQKQLISIPVQIGTGITSCNYDLKVDVNDVTVYQTYDDLKSLPLNVFCYPGENRIECSMFYKDSLGYYDNKVSYYYEAYFTEIVSEADTLTLEIIENKLIFDTPD